MYITIIIDGSFMKNAGIIGLIKFLELNDAEYGKDYIISGQQLKISTEYLKNNNISEMYFNTIVEHFKSTSKFADMTVNKKAEIDKKYNEFIESGNEAKLKDLDADLKIFEDYMLKNSFVSAYKIIGLYDDVPQINESIIKDMKKLKNNIEEKYKKYCEIIEILKNPIIEKNLIYTELLYGKLKYFFAENPTSHKIPVLDTSSKREDTIDKNFYAPLVEHIELMESQQNGKKIKKSMCRCIECMEMSYNSRAITFMTDTTDDVKKKTSYYWNCVVDAYVCPVCAFAYLFVPFGFEFIGSDAVFINTNSSIAEMKSTMSTYGNMVCDENASFRQRVYRIFTEEKIDILNKRISNIQVIVRSSNFSHYEMNVFDKTMIENLSKGKKHLKYLERRYMYGKDNVISVYDSAFENIVSHRSQYLLIDRLMKYEYEKEKGNFGYIMDILYLHIIFNGGAKQEMENLKKKVDIAFMAGKSMRENTFQGNDDAMRGIVYRLINLTSAGDLTQFLDTVIRVYSGYGLTIPSIFKDCYQSDEAFKAIAHGFILGLKYQKNKEDNSND